MKFLLSLIIIILAVSPLNADYLYKTLLVRAAPGELLELISLLDNRMEVYDNAGDDRPFWIHHTQGDQWDLLLLFPMESYEKYYTSSKIEKRKQAAMGSDLNQQAFMQKFNEYVSWDEEVFVYGPPPEQVQNAFKDAGFFHVEMFIALPGKHAELYKQREMENAYLKKLGRPLNLIFVRDQGAAWDLYTIGFYRDIKYYAESADIPAEKKEEAAKLAGFEGANMIGPYLRTLILLHHDTLAVAVK